MDAARRFPARLILRRLVAALIQHVQRLRVDRATLISGGSRFEPVTFQGFVREYRGRSDSGSVNYYMLLRDGEIEALWPWQY